jgi:hypothetical protein
VRGLPHRSRAADKHRFLWNKLVAEIDIGPIKMLRETGTLGTSTDFTVQIFLEQLTVFQVVKKIHAFRKFSQKGLIES